MKRGTILYHSNFRFSNGEYGRKFLIILNNQQGTGPFLMAKVTSQAKNKPRTPGCNPKESLFFIEGGKTWFSQDTWVQLYEIYPFIAVEVLKDHFEGHLEIMHELPNQIANEIKNCVGQLCDISVKYQKMILKNQGVTDFSL